MVLLIDNYDSFTYNLAQYLMELGEEVRVFRNDAITVEEAEKLDFDYLLISPGPGDPDDSGNSLELIRHFREKKPILGVCLGHQCIAAAFDGEVIRARTVQHGKTDLISHDGISVFSGMPDPLRVVRYHSLAVREDSLPADFEVSARSEDGEVMAFRHKTLRIEGVQFHPESVGTESGRKMLQNFIRGVREVPPVRVLLQRLASGSDLAEDEAGFLMDQLSSGELSAVQSGALLTGLAMKGASVEELSGFARVLRDKSLRVSVPEGLRVCDTCGTGGDGSGTFNISTAAAFVAAGAGVTVAKHGNRSITSRSGSADVLEELGVKIDLGPEEAGAALGGTGMCFLFAPRYHPAFKHIMGPRKELGFRTVFNMIGPMINPARVQSQVMGVFAPEFTEVVARVLGNLGVEHVMVLHGADGLDEISLTGTTRITEMKKGWLRTFEFDPREYGFEYCSIEDLKGGDAETNARIITRILKGEKGPHRDIVLLNAAAAIVASGLAADFNAALALARTSIDSGSAMARLDSLAAYAKPAPAAAV